MSDEVRVCESLLIVVYVHANCSYYSSVLLFWALQVFHDIAYKAKDRGDLLAGIDEFLDEVIVLPPGEWDPDIRIEPPKSIPSADKRYLQPLIFTL